MSPAKKVATAAPSKARAKTATATKTKTKAKVVDTNAPMDPRAVSHTVPPQVDDALGKSWHAFKADADVQARERLILHYAPLVEYVASRVATL